MANYLTQEYGLSCSGSQCQSKYYRIIETQRLFTHLRGDSAQPETGIGWDIEHKCFLAEADQWAYLYQVQMYLHNICSPSMLTIVSIAPTQHYQIIRLLFSCCLYAIIFSHKLGREQHMFYVFLQSFMSLHLPNQVYLQVPSCACIKLPVVCGLIFLS